MPPIRVARPPRSLAPRELTDYMARGRVSSALLLFGLVVLVAWLRNGRQLPDRRRTLGLLIGAFIVTLSASYAPEFVTVLMAALFIVIALDAQDQIVEAIRRLQAMIGAPAGSAAAPGAQAGVRPI